MNVEVKEYTTKFVTMNGSTKSVALIISNVTSMLHPPQTQTHIILSIVHSPHNMVIDESNIIDVSPCYRLLTKNILFLTEINIKAFFPLM